MTPSPDPTPIADILAGDWQTRIAALMAEAKRRDAEPQPPQDLDRLRRQRRDQLVAGLTAAGFPRIPTERAADTGWDGIPADEAHWLRRWLDSDRSRSLALVGCHGCRKTGALVALAAALWRDGWRDVAYVGGDALHRTAYSDEGRERLARVRWLVADDLGGCGQVSEHVRAMVEWLLDTRYANGRPTAVSTNHRSLEALGGIYGPGVVSRLLDRSVYAVRRWSSDVDTRTGRRGEWRS
jgi:hypothetical protein